MADVSGQWAASLANLAPDSLTLTLHQGSGGAITGDGARLFLNVPDDLLVIGRRGSSSIELYLTTTPTPPVEGPDTIRAEIGAVTITGEYVSGPFAQAITLRRP